MSRSDRNAVTNGTIVRSGREHWTREDYRLALQELEESHQTVCNKHQELLDEHDQLKEAARKVVKAFAPPKYDWLSSDRLKELISELKRALPGVGVADG